MTPQEFRDAIDDAWPVEIRFMVGRMLQEWEQQIGDRDDALKQMSQMMKSGWMSRLRAKGWRALTDQADTLVEGDRSSSAERDSHEQSERQPEANGESPSREPSGA